MANCTLTPESAAWAWMPYTTVRAASCTLCET